MLRNLFSLAMLCLTASTLLHAQDPSFSQFYANRVYLNPGFTGLESGLTLSGVSRMQWLQVDGGFRTYGFNIELQEPVLNSGIGLSLFRDEQGLAQLETTSVGLSYAYTIPFEGHNIHIGMHARYVQKRLDWSKIVFSDQLDPVHGAIFETAAVPYLDKISFTDFDIGAVWRFVTDINLGKKKRLRNTHHSLGVSLHHMPSLANKNAGSESFQNLDTKVSPRMTVHAGSIIPVWFFNGTKKTISFSPNIKYDVQGDDLFKIKQNLQVTTFGCYIIYDGVYVGALYQNKQAISGFKNTNALIFAFGAFINPKNGSQTGRNKLFFGISYDANTTGVGSRAGGVIEGSFRWTFAKAPGLFGAKDGKRSKKKLDCYKFF